MTEELIRLDNFLDKSLVKNIYTIRYEGKAFSLNQLYAQGHWSIRKNLKDKYEKIFAKLMEDAESKGQLKSFEQYYLVIFYKSRHDVDNVVGMGKVFADTLTGRYVNNDNQKHYRGFCTFVDDDLDQNVFDFMIIDITNG
jgi:hypothetical protein